jgi:hypothetical protein
MIPGHNRCALAREQTLFPCPTGVACASRFKPPAVATVVVLDGYRSRSFHRTGEPAVAGAATGRSPPVTQQKSKRDFRRADY